MRTLLALALLLATPAFADDPEGTRTMELHVGQSKSIPAPDGSRIVCDDPDVAAGQLDKGEFSIKGLKVGTTLCGVRQPGELPGGLYRVRVGEKKKEKDSEPPLPR
jgi:hypothetical protein